MQRILIADADLPLADQYRMHLTREGFEVVAVTDGLACVLELRRLAPDLLVLNPDLLWGGGEGVLSWMYESRGLPVVPVLVLLNRPELFPADHLARFPIDEVHVKPVGPELLARRVRSLSAR